MILSILQAIEGCCCLGPLMVFLFGFLTIEATIPVISVIWGILFLMLVAFVLLARNGILLILMRRTLYVKCYS